MICRRGFVLSHVKGLQVCSYSSILLIIVQDRSTPYRKFVRQVCRVCKSPYPSACFPEHLWSNKACKPSCTSHDCLHGLSFEKLFCWIRLMRRPSLWAGPEIAGLRVKVIKLLRHSSPVRTSANWGHNTTIETHDLKSDNKTHHLVSIPRDHCSSEFEVDMAIWARDCRMWLAWNKPRPWVQNGK